jgi:hypothetical protein
MPNILDNGDWLLVGNSLFSTDDKVELKMQVDGKLALYKEGKLLWQNTAEQDYNIKGVIMQGDGNMVI